MSRKKSHLALIIALLMLPSGMVFAQAIEIHDVQSELYRDLDLWQSAGYLAPLPLIRPYGVTTIRRSLDQVINGESVPESIRRQASEYLIRLEESDGSGGFSLGQSLSGSEAGLYSNTIPELGYRLSLAEGDLGSTWAELRYAGNFLVGEENQRFPTGYRDSRDKIPDWSDIDIAGVNVAIQQYIYSIVSRSQESGDGRALTTFSAGLHRGAIGPNYRDGIILSDQTPAAGNFILGYQRLLSQAPSTGFDAIMNYGLQFMLLGATDDLGQGRYGFKYMIFHHLTFDIAPWLSLGLVESVISGDRFDPVYLIPVSSLFLSQGLGGFGDNSLLGVVGEFRLPHAISIPFTLYTDDVFFNDLVRFEFDTKYKLAFQTAVEWTPLMTGLSQLALDYTAVMPYMYTHYDGDSAYPAAGDPNYSNYTHQGTNIGPGLEPNSDRLVIQWQSSFDLEPEPARQLVLRTIDLSSALRFIRHGNASAGIISDPSGTGSIFDPGYIGQTPTFQQPFDDPTGQPYTRFLTQDVLEKVFQVRMEGALNFAGGRGRSLSLDLAYTFEYVWNEDFVSGENGAGNYLEILFMLGR
jgi:hypothetical protein